MALQTGRGDQRHDDDVLHSRPGIGRGKPDDDTGSEKRANLTIAARPGYPCEARRQGWGGFGVFVIRFGPDGNATKVVTLKSTGYVMLDNEATTTFQRWRCRSGVFTTIKVPITFTPGIKRLR